MSTTTARLGLVKPATSGEVVDISIINDNMDDLDAAAGFTVCTSGTRPGTPYTGQQILETDTGNRYYWSGSYWRGIGVLTCTSGARPTNQRAGQEIYETDTGVTYRYDGTTWRFVSAPTHVCYVARSAADTLTHGVAKAIGMDTETYDPLGMHTGSEAKITIPAGGNVPNTYVYYDVTASVSYNGFSSGACYIQIKVNGGTQHQGAIVYPNSASYGATTPFSKVMQLSPGDYIEVFATQTSGGNLTCGTSIPNNFLHAVRVG